MALKTIAKALTAKVERDARFLPCFATPLDLTLLRERPRLWRVDSPLLYRTPLVPAVVSSSGAARINRMGVIIVPRGFETDLASVPRLPFAWWLAGDTALAPACVHDWLYASKLVYKPLADDIFAEAMKVAGVPAWRRFLMATAVKYFADSAWHRNATARQESAARLLSQYISEAEATLSGMSGRA